MVATRYEPSLKYLMLVLDCDAETLAALPAPDRAQLLVAVRAEDHTLVGVIVTAQGDSSSHFVSRFFAPWAGIDEDPVTGSAHSVLGPFWALNARRAAERATWAVGCGGAAGCSGAYGSSGGGAAGGAAFVTYCCTQRINPA